MVGNEAVFRERRAAASGNPNTTPTHTVKDLIAKIQRVKREVSCAGHHRRGAECLARTSGARVFGRLSRRPHPALLGRHSRLGRRRPCARRLRAAAPGLSGQAHRHRRVRLAERGAQSQGRGAEPAHPGPGRYAISSPAPMPWASTIRSSRPSISRGRPTKEASVPIGACSTPIAIRNSRFAGTVEAPNFVLKVIAALAIGALAVDPDLRHPARDGRASLRASRSPPMRSAPGRPTWSTIG